jgi:steroid delta-isomerase-like uncharacterized protein
MTLSDLAVRFVLEHNQAQYRELLADLLTPDCLVHEHWPGTPPSLDREAYAQFIAMFRASFSEAHIEVNDVIVSGDKAAVRYTAAATHTIAPFLDLPPSGRRVVAKGIFILHFVDRRIAEVWNHWNQAHFVAAAQGD